MTFFRLLPVVILFCFLSSSLSQAKPGQIRHVVPFNGVKVFTDPTKGVNSFARWSVFPSAPVETRRAILSVTYRCPDSLHCGEWDYIDNIAISRLHGTSGKETNIEIARLISPYGWKFDSTWHFTWHVDVTDFAPLLHDSVQIRFDHAGYENDKDRGWAVTLDFELMEGRPAMEFLGMDTLWHGSIPYGDTLMSFDRWVPPYRFGNTRGADIARLRILQTGHGMDDGENCAEFCSKYRQIIYDDSVVDFRQVWRRCGTNALYPQGGTWIYDRANWCPGSMVAPDCYDLALAGRDSHSVAVVMQPYLNRKHPTASYVVSSYLLYYKSPWAVNDVSLQEIVAPSAADEYLRMNPVCDNPRIVIRNNARQPLTSCVIRYGIPGDEQTYRWEGNLESQKNMEITIPAILPKALGRRKFSVRLISPNGKTDDVPEDNDGSAEMDIPPVYGSNLVFVMMTNRDSSSIGYQVFDQNGGISAGHRIGMYRANTVYRDTLRLKDGCYQMLVTDTLGDGLDFWANPEGGYGYARLLDLNGRLLKAWGSDFGSEISHSFTIAAGTEPIPDSSAVPLVNIFPVRNPGKFSVEIFFNDPQPVTTIAITTEDGLKTVYSKDYSGLKESILPIDITRQPDGFYYLKLTAGGRAVSKKFKVKHTG